MKKRLICLSILLGAIMLCIGFTNTANASTLKLNKTNVTLSPKQKVQLKLKGTKKTVKWSSNKKSVASVSKKGKITAKKTGTATVTAKIGKKKYKCKVTVLTSEKIYSKLGNIYKYFDTFYNESIDISSLTSIENSIKAINKAKVKHSSFINSLQGKKYNKYKSRYNEILTELTNIYVSLNDMLGYINSDYYEEYSDTYYNIKDSYDAAKFALWGATEDMWNELVYLSMK